jgi:transposase InsO family protein
METWKKFEEEVGLRITLNSQASMTTQAEHLLNPHKHHLSLEAKKRLRWLYTLYNGSEISVSAAASRQGISREWLSKIKSTFEKHNRDPRALEPNSRAPRRTNQRRRISAAAEAAILEIRDHAPCWGKEKIARILFRDYAIKVAPSTVNRYLKKHGRVNPHISKKNTIAWQNKKQKEQRILKVKHRPPSFLKDYAPGALIEKDMKFVLKQGKFSNTIKHKAKENFYYQHTEIDSFTRIRTLELVQSADSAKAAKAHERACRRFPFPVAAYNTDNGSENEKEFSKALHDTETFHFYSGVGTPTDNPRVERSHLTDEREFYQQGNQSKSIASLQEALKAWEYTYNYVRPHQALSYLTPIEFYALWKENKEEAYAITKKYKGYLIRQRKRIANVRRIKRQEQIEALMEFIDAKLNPKIDIEFYKKSLINCELCSWP